MDLDDVQALTGYWRYRPPVHVILAAYFKLEKPKTVTDPEKIAELLGYLGGGARPEGI